MICRNSRGLPKDETTFKTHINAFKQTFCDGILANSGKRVFIFIIRRGVSQIEQARDVTDPSGFEGQWIEGCARLAIFLRRNYQILGTCEPITLTNSLESADDFVERFQRKDIVKNFYLEVRNNFPILFAVVDEGNLLHNLLACGNA